MRRLSVSAGDGGAIEGELDEWHWRQIAEDRVAVMRVAPKSSDSLRLSNIDSQGHALLRSRLIQRIIRRHHVAVNEPGNRVFPVAFAIVPAGHVKYANAVPAACERRGFRLRQHAGRDDLFREALVDGEREDSRTGRNTGAANRRPGRGERASGWRDGMEQAARATTSGSTNCRGPSSKVTTSASSTAVKALASTTCMVASISTVSPDCGSSTPGMAAARSRRRTPTRLLAWDTPRR